MRNSKNPSESSLMEITELKNLIQQENLSGIAAFLEQPRSKKMQQILFARTGEFLALQGRSKHNIEYLYWARQYGLQCLKLDANFANVIQAHHGEVSKQAIEALNEQDLSTLQCAQWLLVGWSLWLDYRGSVGVGNDIVAVQSLGEWLIRSDSLRLSLDESVLDIPWIWYGYALSQSLGESYYTVDWSKVQKGFENAGVLDDLMRFEYQYHYVRFVNVSEYCDYSELGDIPLPIQERWDNSQYLCTTDAK